MDIATKTVRGELIRMEVNKKLIDENMTIEEFYELMRGGEVEDNGDSNGFTIDTEEKALWAANKISDAHMLGDLRKLKTTEVMEREKAYFEKRMEKYQAELDRIDKDTLNGTDFLKGLLGKYFYDKKISDKKYMFRHPFVKLKLSPKTKVYDYDDEKIGKYLMENHPDKAEKVIKFSKADVKKIFKIVDDMVIDTETGEDTDLVKITEKPQIPQIKIEK